MKIGKVFFLLALIIVVENAPATELWGGAIVGMSKEEVQKLLPATVASENDGLLLPGATKGLVLPETEFFGYPFVTEFYFSDEGLIQVVMVNNSLNKKRQIRKACTELKTLFVDDFGNATASRITKSMLGTSDHSIYVEDDLVARLTCGAPFWPLRMVFQPRSWTDEHSPFGLSMGMSIDELRPLMKEPIPEEADEPVVAGEGMAVILEAPLSHVPDMPVGDGELSFRVRASQGHGLCSITVTLSVVEDKGMEYLFSKASLMPNQDLFGTPSDVGGMFGAFKFSILPKPTPMASSDTWVTTVDDQLPGSIDKMIFVMGSANVDGVKKHVESLQIQFTNSHTCGLSRDDIEGFK